jgi:hypothetical protein
MTITGTTIVSGFLVGVHYGITITEHNGHTTKVQFENDAGWRDVSETEFITPFDGEVLATSERMRIDVAGGSGNLELDIITVK